VDLPIRRHLAHRLRRVEHVYFIDDGLGSIVADGTEQPIEVGIIGRDGFSSPNVLLGAERSPHDVFMQIAGKGHRIRADILCHADQESPTLHRVLMRYINALLTQIAQTAQANGKSNIEERLARWLLMARDRVESDELALTHEFLSLMLGTPRPGVTAAVGRLSNDKVISPARGKITILDRPALEEKAKGIYLPPAEE
jgi:CRP-like cAMP-binding protein